MSFDLESLAPSLISLIRLSSAVNAKDISFYNSIDATVKSESTALNQHLIDLLNELLPNAFSISSDQDGQLHADKKDENWKVVSSVLDTLFENAEIALEEGTKKEQTSHAKDEFTYLDENDTSGTRKSTPQSLKIEKPQLLFKTPVNNFETSPFKPLITSKPNALIPLQKSVQLVCAAPDVPEHYENPYSYEIMNQPYPEWILQQQESFDSIPWKESEEPTWIDNPAQLDDLLVELSRCRVIAVDLEHHDYRTYHGITCLMQLTTDTKKDYLIDPLSPELRPHLVNLNVIFTDPNIVKVFHGAFMDIIWLQRDLGLYVVSLFDTYHAARELGLGRHSLAHLLETYVKFKTSKKWQLADWRLRPLNSEMKNYAKADTHFLIEVFYKMHRELVQNPDKLKKVLYESRRVSNRRYEYSTFKPRNVKSANGFSSGAEVVATNQSVPQLPEFKNGLLSVQNATNLPWSNLADSNSIPMAKRPLLEVLFKWRDEQARREDESPRYIMSDFMLVSLVNAFSQDSEEVSERTVLEVVNSSSRFGGSQFVRTRLKELVMLIQNCLEELKQMDAALWDSVYETKPATTQGGSKDAELAFETVKQDFEAANRPIYDGIVLAKEAGNGVFAVRYTRNGGVTFIGADVKQQRLEKALEYLGSQRDVAVDVSVEPAEEQPEQPEQEAEAETPEPESRLTSTAPDEIITLRKHQQRRRKQDTPATEKLDTSQKIMVSKPQQKKRKVFEPYKNEGPVAAPKKKRPVTSGRNLIFKKK
ncbi:hypothetical protein KL933_000155 [Ogataea haglerorum]|uniref:HRDC domain-containing protein n=1 Tax=Ogataea haglerorum TaxID=1937702 RepID=A0AAN6D9R4_9ASCO|nr:hypothetical protein KL915_004246 [Ogataea haglerorum]KAG7711969.1 hypothetical protein KL914_000611 [Ogataea haglerorum]KAG7712740.1 hypothetical protein KL950_000611 [Ogataea haglerorum]KAG7730360.1 hypothetical protein KL933_000155 [Ogataea haglerorum]KAG7742537.1 hypothetical protein KL923_000152 [Ogataea haglerorum]